jgi:hypothetical protein
MVRKRLVVVINSFGGGGGSGRLECVTGRVRVL